MYLFKFLTILCFTLKSPESNLKTKGFNDLFFKIDDEKLYLCAQSAQKFLSRILFLDGLEVFQLRKAVYPEVNGFDLSCMDISNHHNLFLLFPAFSGSQRLNNDKNIFEKEDFALGYFIYSEFFIGSKFQYISCDVISFMLMPFIFKFIIPKYSHGQKIDFKEIFSSLYNDEGLDVITKMKYILNRLIEIYTISCLTQKSMFCVINEDCSQILEKFKNNQSYIYNNKLVPLLKAFSPLKMNKDNFLKDFNVNKRNIESVLNQCNSINSIRRINILLNCVFCNDNFDLNSYVQNYQITSLPLKINSNLNTSLLSTNSQGLSYLVEAITPK